MLILGTISANFSLIERIRKWNNRKINAFELELSSSNSFELEDKTIWVLCLELRPSWNYKLFPENTEKHAIWFDTTEAKDLSDMYTVWQTTRAR